ncbi:MAG: ABC transporter ATP-binding protein [Candidatus Omnitrophica bacterium]|nr:ABC transporter ATP-binding protein [Candidatus Omnitrophota bacterium]
MIKIKGLGKNYQNGADLLEVLKGIDLEVEKSEFLAIQGPSGAGKSTLLHILGGLDFPSKGEIFFAEENIYRLNESQRAEFRNRKIGFVFQFYHLLPEFNALENVALPALLKNWWEKRKIIDYAKTLLARLGLSQRLGHRPAQLSGGEQQRVAIARALINQPQVLLCDEPTGNLDSESGKNILALLKELHQQEKTTIVLVTHDNDIASAADRIIHLRDGRLLN